VFVAEIFTIEAAKYCHLCNCGVKVQCFVVCS